MVLIDFLTANLAGLGLGAVTAFFSKNVLKYVFNKFKPIEPFVDYAKNKAYSTGLKTRTFSIDRLGEASALTVLKELADSSEEIQDAYVKGLNGINF